MFRNGYSDNSNNQEYYGQELQNRECLQQCHQTNPFIYHNIEETSIDTERKHKNFFMNEIYHLTESTRTLIKSGKSYFSELINWIHYKYSQ